MTTTIPAYYISTTGSDSNPGTIAAPFATFGRAQQAMQNSSTKTTYILAGNYSPAGNANSPNGSAVLNLGPADSNETWSYYPPDGYGSAHITGGGTISTFMSINGATGVTVNGLDISNFTSVGIKVTNGSSNANIINNTIHDMPQYGITLDDQGAAVNNTLISNNYLYNIGNNGISIYSIYNNGTNDNTISNNIIVNAASTIVGGGNPYADAGSIYAQDLNSGASTGNTITNNYLGQSSGLAIYLDDGASNYTVTGNVLAPGQTGYALVQIHGGDNNVFSGNIGDVSTGLIGGFVFYQQSGNPNGARGMTGNVWEDNILVGSIDSGGGNGYTGGLNPPAALTIQNNDYWNYGSGGNLVSTGSDGAGSDANPTDEDPQITGSAYNISPGSPVFSSPVNFPGITGAWGPPDLVPPGPQTVIGGAGQTLIGSLGTDLINGLAGPESITGGSGSTSVWGGSGDTITGSIGTLSVDGSLGGQLIAGGSGASLILGGDGDTITGSTGSGASTVIGAQHDTITGGSGTDLINGTLGSQSITGGSGTTTVWGGAADTITGGVGTLWVDGSLGGQLIGGGSGASLIIGGDGDTITGSIGSGASTVIGAQGDMITGGSGTDLINGTLGSQSIASGSGSTTVWGGSGDTITGGTGTLTVDIDNVNFPGSELVGDNGTQGSDTVTGFSQSAGDRILFPNETTDAINSVVATAQSSNGNTLITFSDGGLMTLIGITKIDASFFA
jgi:hypothetical protein